jgi:hypothetical protein
MPRLARANFEIEATRREEKPIGRFCPTNATVDKLHRTSRHFRAEPSPGIARQTVFLRCARASGA